VKRGSAKQEEKTALPEADGAPSEISRDFRAETPAHLFLQTTNSGQWLALEPLRVALGTKSGEHVIGRFRADPGVRAMAVKRDSERESKGD
jgi:hypothetical protein